MNVTKKIEVLPYNPLWQEQFEAEAKQIKEALGGICSAIYHVGSTSVPGLAAKPKIDIILSVKDHPEKTIEKLKPLGFDYRGQFNIPMHYGFNKRGAVNVNLHVYKEGHPEIELNLTFRDYLRSHPKTRDEYAALKLDLLKEKSSFEKKDSFFTGYNLGKDAFIRKVLKAAGFQLLRFVICTHYNEWEMAKKFRSRFFKAIHKKVQELANGTASARDLNRDLSRFSNPPPIGDRLGGEKFKDRDAGAASCQLLNLFVYI
jgi:GrpB-like predicted nucleotidyltransferase (UPF0157 family)